MKGQNLVFSKKLRDRWSLLSVRETCVMVSLLGTIKEQEATGQTNRHKHTWRSLNVGLVPIKIFLVQKECLYITSIFN